MMSFLALLRNLVNAGLRPLGYEVQRIGRGLAGYEPIKPVATYSPWNTDELFLKTYNAIQANTLVDKFRCYELWTLVAQTRQLEGDLIEVGVWRGGTGALIAKRATLSGMDAVVYLCDTFAGVVKASGKDTLYVGGEHSDTSREMVETIIRSQGLTNTRILTGIFPDQTASLITQTRFRFCHVDVDVYDSAKDVVEWVWDKLVVGGIIVYDDYGFFSCPGIARYVDEQRGNADRLIIHNLNGHAVVVKLS